MEVTQQTASKAERNASETWVNWEAFPFKTTSCSNFIMINKTEFIAATNHGLCKYNINNNKCCLFFKYVDQMTLVPGSMSMDYESNKLYAYNETNDSIFIFDLNKGHTMQYLNQPQKPNIKLRVESSVIINGKYNIICSSSRYNHLVWDMHQSRFTVVHAKIRKGGIEGHGLLYIKSKNALLLFGGGNGKSRKKLCYYEIEKALWTELQTKIPFKCSKFVYVLSNDEKYVIFLGANGNNIYILNLSTMIFQRSSFKIPTFVEYGAIITPQNEIHLITKTGRGHFKIKLEHIVESIENDNLHKKTRNNPAHSDKVNTSQQLKLEMNPHQEIRYKVMDLIKKQPLNLSINWFIYKDIPRSIRFVSLGIDNKKYMENVVAMFERKASNPWLAASHSGTAPTGQKEKVTKKLTGVLNKITPKKFSKFAKLTMDIIHEFGATKEVMDNIIGVILQFCIKQPIFATQYINILNYLHAHLPELAHDQWMLRVHYVNDPDASRTFRRMVIQQTNDLFNKHRDHSSPDIPDIADEGKEIALDIDPEMVELRRAEKKENFLAVMVLVAELYNVELIKKNLVYKGVCDVLLPPTNKKLSKIDLEGLCHLFKRCGKKLEQQGKKHVDKYLQKLQTHARDKFDFRTKVLVDNIIELRKKNGWQHELKKENAKIKYETRMEFKEKHAVMEAKEDNHRRGGDKGERYGGRYRVEQAIDSLRADSDKWENNVYTTIQQLEQQRINHFNTVCQQLDGNIAQFYREFDVRMKQLDNRRIQHQAVYDQYVQQLQQEMHKMCGIEEKQMNEIKEMECRVNELLKDDTQQIDETNEIKTWLIETVKLPQYFDILINYYCVHEDIHCIVDMTDDQLKQVGIDKIGHRRKIIKYQNNLRQHRQETLLSNNKDTNNKQHRRRNIDTINRNRIVGEQKIMKQSVYDEI